MKFVSALQGPHKVRFKRICRIRLVEVVIMQREDRRRRKRKGKNKREAKEYCIVQGK